MSKNKANKIRKLLEHYHKSQLCPNCKTGEESVKMFPECCPYIDNLKINENSGTTVLHKDGTSTTYYGYECSHFTPVIPPLKLGRFADEKYTPPASVKSDNVNHPDHYTTGKYECIDYIEDKLTDDEFRGYIKGNVLKYLTRERHKNGDEDILKAQFYLNRLCNKIKGDESNG